MNQKRALLLLLLLLPVLALIGFLGAGALLASPSGIPIRSDAIVVLGGESGVRYSLARQMLVDGYSSRLLLINPSDFTEKEVLGNLRGVDIEFDSLPRNTWQEARAVRNWMLAKDFKSVLVVSDSPHMLRVMYAFSSNFRGTDLTYTLTASTPHWWSTSWWWQNPHSYNVVTSEVQKLGYYVVRYGFGLWN